MTLPLSTSRFSWYCLRSQSKHEHIAARCLRQVEGLEVFCPRIRFRRITQQGVKWVTESLFPNYLFARFDPEIHQVRVRYAQGVAGIVHFGERLAAVSETAVVDLRRRIQDDQPLEMPGRLVPGDGVTVAAAPFSGLEAVVTHVLPARQRVRILLEFLGRATEVEVGAHELVCSRQHPLTLAD